ncbi:MAG: hypothetical protein GXO14_00910 [Thermococci archaeon]|nr:hypothetical protein [Thermococci archaeon]
MTIFDEGNAECVKELLRPAEQVIGDGLDVRVEDYETRVDLWNRVSKAYGEYRSGRCGGFLKDLDIHFRAKFEGALAILAWSFKKNGEDFAPALRRYSDEELEGLERILRYNVFEIMDVKDIIKRLSHRDENLLTLLREYYLGVDKWIDGYLENPEVKLYLRRFLKDKWDSYKGKVSEAIAEATKELDWFRDFLTEEQKEREDIVGMYRKRIAELMERIEKEREEVRKQIESATEERIARLMEENERLRKEFEEEKRRLVEEISRVKDEEARRMLEEQLRKASENIKALEDELRRKQLQLAEKETELRRKEVEIREKEREIAKKIEEVMRISTKVEKGSRYVTAGEAKMLELNFIGRMTKKFKPGSEVKVLGRKFSVKEVREDSAYTPGEEFKGRVPENRSLTVRMREKKFFGGKEEITVRALFLGRPERYESLGIDTDPIELEHVTKILDEALNGPSRTILLVASPTGFESRIRDFINSGDFHRNFSSEKVSLALLDLESGELIINPNDDYANAFRDLLRLETNEEVLRRVKDAVESKLAAKDYVRLEEVDGPVDVVKRVFYELGREKNYRTRFVDGVGLVIMRVK